MNKPPKPDAQAEKRMDEVLRKMLATPPAPFTPKAKPKRKKRSK